MERWRTESRLPEIIDALTREESDPAVQRLVSAFGGDPGVRETALGEPVVTTRRLGFACGGEIVVRDGVVAAIILHVKPGFPHHLLSEWTGVSDDATLGDLVEGIGARRRFAGISVPYLELDGAYARADFLDGRGWNTPGNLRALAIVSERPGLALAPDAEDCTVCAGLLVRFPSPASGLDASATVARIIAAVDAGALREDPRWVPFGDALALQASGLMDNVESHAKCLRCHRVLCLALSPHEPGTLHYLNASGAARRRMGIVPPLEQWADDARIARARREMRYVDHDPGRWFLVEQEDVLFLESRYAISSMAEDSALVRLDADELRDYRASGREALTALALRIDRSGAATERSPYFARDLYRSDESGRLRDAVSRAIINHTWLAEQRRR